MTMRKYIHALLLGLLLAAGSARANFHLWSMQELYSNADGSVQFLELRALAGGQEFLGGHTLTSSSAGVEHSFVFPSSLPGDTSGKTMIIGTQGFASLNIVTPDYIVPNGFFFKGGGVINFSEVDIWIHGPIPDGTLSLSRDGSTATNSPKNFQGTAGSVPSSTPQASFNVHGLWWNDPDNSEAGWGVNLSHHGNIVFLSWFTYDTAGTAMWLFMSNAARTATNTYSGEIYRSTGAPFDAYNPASFNLGPSVGTGTLTFSDEGHGRFSYIVNGISQSKNIKRYIFGPLPTCDQSGAAATNFTDLWGLTSEAGWGVNVVQQNNIVFASWFTYAADGRGTWFFGSGLTRTSGNTFTGDLFRASSGPAFNTNNWSATPVVAPKVGTATLNFTGPSTGTFSYTVDSVTQTKNIARNVHAAPPTTCR
ncbi:MAG TPA: hypothetical protein VM122_01700 [Usitatibacter sp.]|nr:hypothetical protein [Usitatibacter sp.]